MEDYLRLSTVRALRAVSSIQAHWMEDTFQFDSVADQQEYGSGDSGYPLDVQEFHTIYTTTGVANQEVEIRSISYIRKYGNTAGPDIVYPPCVAYHHRKLVFPYPLKAGVTFYGDYLKEATRDATTGAVITADDETTTNPWFVEGEDILRSRVLADYHLLFSKDVEAGNAYRAVFMWSTDELKKARNQLRAKGFQAEASW